MEKDREIEILELKLEIAKLEKKVQELECENRRLRCNKPCYPYWKYEPYIYTTSDLPYTITYTGSSDSCTF